NSNVIFNEPVTIASANPSVGLTIDGNSRSLTGTQATNSSFTFSYTIVADEYDYDGVTVASSLSLNGATITDAAGNELSDNSLSPPDASNVRIVAEKMTVWLDAANVTTLFSDAG